MSEVDLFQLRGSNLPRLPVRPAATFSPSGRYAANKSAMSSAVFQNPTRDRVATIPDAATVEVKFARMAARIDALQAGQGQEEAQADEPTGERRDDAKDASSGYLTRDAPFARSVVGSDELPVGRGARGRGCCFAAVARVALRFESTSAARACAALLLASLQ